MATPDSPSESAAPLSDQTGTARDGGDHAQDLAAIAQSVETGRVEMSYQPVVDMRDGRILGWEALARFPGVPFGTEEVFEAVRGTELEIELELLCFRKAVEVADQLGDGRYLSVNLSPRAMSNPRVVDLLRSAGPLLEHLVIEITERTPVEDYLPLYRPLHELRQQLVSVAIDDVGAGYASLWHITQLLPDMIKIDRALISGIDQSPTKRAIVTALLSLARELRCQVVAEGVEHKQEAEWLVGLGTRFGQGFHFAKPQRWRPLAAGERPQAACPEGRPVTSLSASGAASAGRREAMGPTVGTRVAVLAGRAVPDVSHPTHPGRRAFLSRPAAPGALVTAVANLGAFVQPGAADVGRWPIRSIAASGQARTRSGPVIGECMDR